VVSGLSNPTGENVAEVDSPPASPVVCVAARCGFGAAPIAPVSEMPPAPSVVPPPIPRPVSAVAPPGVGCVPPPGRAPGLVP